jgi:hypothetical protein
MRNFLDTLDQITAKVYGEDLTDFFGWFEETDGKAIVAGIVTTLDLRDYMSYRNFLSLLNC